MESSRTYFPGLNGLRFFAAFAVLVTHVEFTKKIMRHGDYYWLPIDKWIQGSAFESMFREGGLPAIHWISPFVTQGGYMGVIFFFVLSGFLITYLLLEEKRVSNTVAVRKFYFRRILRIWPLYYLVVLLGFFVLHHLPFFEVKTQEDQFFSHYWLNFASYMCMLPNLGFAIVMEAVPNLGHLWSIGVEEQFYLMWPLLLKFAKKPIRTIFIFLAVVLSIKVFVMVLFTVVYPQPHLDPDLMIFSPVESLKRFIGTLKFEAMAIGGLGACMLFYKKEKLLAIVYSRFIQIAAYISIPVIVLFTPKSMYTALYLFFSVPFLIIILNVATNERSIFKLRSKVFDFLGRISFGIYMYHLICIAFAFHVLDYIIEFPALLEGWHTLLLYLVSIPMTIGVSSVSYFYFEKKFIQRKRKYTTVVSGDDAR